MGSRRCGVGRAALHDISLRRVRRLVSAGPQSFAGRYIPDQSVFRRRLQRWRAHTHRPTTAPRVPRCTSYSRSMLAGSPMIVIRSPSRSTVSPRGMTIRPLRRTSATSVLAGMFKSAVSDVQVGHALIDERVRRRVREQMKRQIPLVVQQRLLDLLLIARDAPRGQEGLFIHAADECSLRTQMLPLIGLRAEQEEDGIHRTARIAQVVIVLERDIDTCRAVYDNHFLAVNVSPQRVRQRGAVRHRRPAVLRGLQKALGWRGPARGARTTP